MLYSKPTLFMPDSPLRCAWRRPTAALRASLFGALVLGCGVTPTPIGILATSTSTS